MEMDFFHIFGYIAQAVLGVLESGRLGRILRWCNWLRLMRGLGLWWCKGRNIGGCSGRGSVWDLVACWGWGTGKRFILLCNPDFL